MNKNSKIANRKYEFFYLMISTLQKDELIQYPVIFERETQGVHPFTDYLRDSFKGFTLRNKTYNTIVNFYVNYVIIFLNFIFNESKNKIDNIEDLNLDIVQEFIDIYCQGKLTMKTSERKPNKDTVDKVNTAITYFIYWLCWKKDKAKRKMYKMNYISINDFQTKIFNKRTMNENTYKKESLCHLVPSNPSRKINKRKKVMQAGKYTIERLIELALHNDPMMAFGIVLGAYAGLRQGYVTQMHDRRLYGFEAGLIFNMRFDFKYESLLRDDGRLTSSLKRKCDIPIYPGCAEVIYTYYQFHIEFLRSKGLYPNKYGVLFIDERGNAMTRKTYIRRFKELSKKLEVVITEEANMGISEAISEQRMLSDAFVSHHSLRHYFKQLIEAIEKNQTSVAFFLAQKSLKSQLDYAPPATLTEKVRKCQDEAISVKRIIKN